MSTELPVEVLIAAAIDDIGRAPVGERAEVSVKGHDVHSPWKSAGPWRIDH
jgi:hypothetical protein